MNRADLPAPNATCEVCGRKYRKCQKCIEMRSRGIETWRQHCDSIECYQTLVLVNVKDISTIMRDEYERVVSFELPDGRKPIPEIQKKLNSIKTALDERDKKKEKEENYKAEDKKKSTKGKNSFNTFGRM